MGELRRFQCTMQHIVTLYPNTDQFRPVRNEELEQVAILDKQV